MGEPWKKYNGLGFQSLLVAYMGIMSAKDGSFDYLSQCALLCHIMVKSVIWGSKIMHSCVPNALGMI
ncbi:hypothetical protein BCT01_13315 [Vibrio tasmaniensis]|nr:hypothetical protein BCT01_13315 [Vibrio tasmaniensis]